MIKQEYVNGLLFLEQTTYYIYRNEEDLVSGTPLLITSSKELFERNKERAKANKPLDKED